MSFWHTVRRAWASTRKHRAPNDMAAAGGWLNGSVLRGAPPPGTLSEPAHDPGVTTPAEHAISVVRVGRTRPLT